MKQNNKKSIIIFLAIVILGVLVFISTQNILFTKNGENTYYAKTEKEVDKKIYNIRKSGNKLEFEVKEDVNKYCLKTTKSNPSSASLCWQFINNSKQKITIIEGKKYYLWIQDTQGNISNEIELAK
jgi:sortase (surface protein transpeptidase)